VTGAETKINNEEKGQIWGSWDGYRKKRGLIGK
jgi:hypothetical protein